MEQEKNISDAQMKVMDIIWRKEAMVTVPEMVSLLKEEGEEWAYQTVATFLKRLEDKKNIRFYQNRQQTFLFSAYNQSGIQKREAHGFVNRKFGGSLMDFLAAFSGGSTADDKEIKELKEWLSKLDDD